MLLDLELPDIDGFEVLRRIRADRRLAATPVVAFTAMALPSDVDRIQAAGFDGRIVKPIDPESFLDDVARYLGDGVHSKE